MRDKLMNVYSLTQKGREKFEKMRDNSQLFNTAGYKILDYLFESGTCTVKELVGFAGVSRSEAMEKLNHFIRQGSVEVLEKL